jgi:hypothetical protein
MVGTCVDASGSPPMSARSSLCSRSRRIPPMGLILDIYEANGLNFPPIKKRNPTSLKHISHKTSLFSRAVRLQLCRQSTVPVAKSSAQAIRYRGIGSVKDRPTWLCLVDYQVLSSRATIHFHLAQMPTDANESSLPDNRRSRKHHGVRSQRRANRMYRILTRSGTDPRAADVPLCVLETSARSELVRRPPSDLRWKKLGSCCHNWMVTGYYA